MCSDVLLPGVQLLRPEIVIRGYVGGSFEIPRGQRRVTPVQPVKLRRGQGPFDGHDPIHPFCWSAP